MSKKIISFFLNSQIYHHPAEAYFTQCRIINILQNKNGIVFQILWCKIVF